MKSQKISALLQKISAVIENPVFPAVSKLERDLLMQHIRDLYEETDNALNDKQAAETIVTAKKEEPEETTVLIKRPVMRANDNLLMKEEPVVQKNTTPINDEPAKSVVTASAAVEHEVINSHAIKPESKPEMKVEKVVQTQVTINETIKTGGSLNEKMKTSSVVEMHKKLATKPLKELIDLNKKFVLLNELFKGNAEAYAAAIAHIDTLPHYEAAQSFISTQLVTNYYWDESKQSTRMFSKLIKTKFGVE